MTAREVTVTEDAVRAVFFKHFSGDNLNKALIATLEEICLAVMTEVAGSKEAVPDIVKTIFRGNSRLGLFMGLFVPGNEHLNLDMYYVHSFDTIRKAMLDAVNYMHENYETVQPWFREQYRREDLKKMSGDASAAIERPSGLATNDRSITYVEIKLAEEFFPKALIGIFGHEQFQKYGVEYNRCVNVLRQCQMEAKMLSDMANEKVS